METLTIPQSKPTVLPAPFTQGSLYNVLQYYKKTPAECICGRFVLQLIFFPNFALQGLP